MPNPIALFIRIWIKVAKGHGSRKNQVVNHPLWTERASVQTERDDCLNYYILYILYL
jgi:hypothetical protein